MDIRYALNAVKRNWHRIDWWSRMFNSFVAGGYHDLIVENDGRYVMDEDWDDLIILDGCRYDVFEDVAADHLSLPGVLRCARSRGTGSPEFIEENYSGERFEDTVYVTANPYVEMLLEGQFAHIEHVWLNGWNDELETVEPERMVEETRRLREQYPNKRFIIHFMQPHHPFIGETRLEEDSGFTVLRSKVTGDEIPDDQFVWERLKRGELDREQVWEAYRSNLKRVLPAAEEIAKETNAKTVITSDHGNAFGERASPFPTRIYGHGTSVRIPALVDVPWFEVEAETRRKITSTNKRSTAKDAEDDVIEDRLESLGYRA